MQQSINVYTDGACSNNGKSNAKAGYGVYFGDNDFRNENRIVVGKHSNNTGELTGFIRALEILEDDIKKNKQINIFTDSEYVIKCVTTYGLKLEKRNWKSKLENKIVPNLDLVKKAFYLFHNKPNIKLHHIEAHTNKDDRHSKGNEEADRLACLAIGVNPDEQKKARERRNENIIKMEWITFNLKDKAKEYGAKWDVKNKYWYADENVSEENMKKLIEMQSEKPKIEKKTDALLSKQYLKISFAKKDKAKSLGARWDSNVKSWYYIESDISEEKKQELLKL